MGATTKIEWTEKTPIEDRAGNRIRYYTRKDPTKPGAQIRKIMLAEGWRWCRECSVWLPAKNVERCGACRSCLNAEARALYRDNENYREKRRAHRDRRRRGAERMPAVARELLTELFDGECAYCESPAESWDHFVPVTKRGTTAPGNMLPACRSCNSRKRNKDPDRWLESLPFVKPFTAEYLCVIAGAF